MPYPFNIANVPLSLHWLLSARPDRKSSPPPPPFQRPDSFWTALADWAMQIELSLNPFLPWSPVAPASDPWVSLPGQNRQPNLRIRESARQEMLDEQARETVVHEVIDTGDMTFVDLDGDGKYTAGRAQSRFRAKFSTFPPET